MKMVVWPVITVLGLVLLVLVAVIDSDEEGHGEEGHGKEGHGYGHGHGHGHYKHHKYCYQCSYSPPKHVSEKHVKYHYEHHEHEGYGHGGGHEGGHGGGHGGGYGHEGYGHYYPTYYYSHHYLNGGWDKCLGPFDHYQAKHYGIDTWDCHYGNCYVRKDPNGDIFRGCYKGEYYVDQHKLGCHYQGGSLYCFCEGELCNNGPVGYH